MSLFRRRTDRGAAWEPFAIGSGLIGIAVSLVLIYPLVALVAVVAWGNGTFGPGIAEAIRVVDLPKTLLDTGLVVGVSGLIGIGVGSALAWLNERTDARIPIVTDVIPIVNFLVPSIAGAVGWLLLLSPRAGYLNAVLRAILGTLGIGFAEGPLTAYSWYAVIAVYAIGFVPLVFVSVSAGLRALDSSLIEQSRISGANGVETFVRIVLPALAPSLGTAMFLIAWYGLALFSVPLVLADPAGIDILSVQIVRLLTFTYPPKVAGAAGLGAIVIVVLASVWIVQRRILGRNRFARLGGKGARVSRTELGKWRPVVRALVLLYLAVTVVLPILALATVSLNGFWTLDIDWSNLGLGAMARLLDDETTGRSVRNSILLATATALIGVPIAGLISVWVSTSRWRFARVVDGLVKLPAALSSIVVALGFVLAYAGAPFFLGGTLVILLMAYVILSLPQASVNTDNAVGQVGSELVEASRISGAGSGETFRRIYLPLMVPGLVAAWALVFVRVVGDLEASALLASSGNTVVGFQILGIFENGNYNQLAALALLMTAMSAGVLSCLLLVSRRLSRWRSSSGR